MTISNELLKGCKRPEDLLGDTGLMKEIGLVLSEAALEPEPQTVVALARRVSTIRHISTACCQSRLLRAKRDTCCAAAARRQPVAHRMLQGAALAVVQHLMGRGLPHMEDRRALQMVSNIQSGTSSRRSDAIPVRLQRNAAQPAISTTS